MRDAKQSDTKIAVIGCGYWGKNLVRNFRQLGVLASVCDVTESGRLLATQLAPEVTVSADVESILTSDAQGVVIATPATTHYNIAKQALNAGKDVFVEKPLALTREQADTLVQLADAQNKILMVGHVLEYHPAIRQLHSLLDSGELGQLRYVYTHRLSFGKIRHEENVLWSFAPHDIAVLLSLLGTLPLQVSARGGDYIQSGIADSVRVDLQFSGEQQAHVFVSWLHPFKEQRLVVVGSEKMASFDDVSKTLTLYDHSVTIVEKHPQLHKAEAELIPFAQDEPLRLECEAFLSAISSRIPPLTDGQSGVRVLRVLEAAQRSLAASGEIISLASAETVTTS